ncbi:MAG: hypothetical protein WC404_06210 [Candidatus Omnitrophota bacterium]|jgi:hypothetical protein
MATSQEYLREIETKIDSLYSGALRDAADRLDKYEAACRGAIAALSQNKTFPADIEAAKSFLQEVVK